VPVQPSSSRVRRVLARCCFRSGFVLGFRCSWFADGPSFSSGRSGSRADGPPGLRGRSVFLGLFLVVLLALTDGPRLLAGRSSWPFATFCGTWPDSPPAPGSFVPWFDSSLLSFVLPRVFKESFLRLGVDP
jgi:hypothetical protein